MVSMRSILLDFRYAGTTSSLPTFNISIDTIAGPEWIECLAHIACSTILRTKNEISSVTVFHLTPNVLWQFLWDAFHDSWTVRCPCTNIKSRLNYRLRFLAVMDLMHWHTLLIPLPLFHLSIKSLTMQLRYFRRLSCHEIRWNRASSACSFIHFPKLPHNPRYVDFRDSCDQEKNSQFDECKQTECDKERQWCDIIR